MNNNQITMQPEESYKIIRNSVITAQSKVYTVVNSAMVQAYWEIGQEIHKACGENDRAEYGKKLLEYLSEHLTKEFGKGFTVANLKNMRQFYRTFPIRQTLSSELSWSHYNLLMRIEDNKAREFYANESVKGNWSVRQLKRQIGAFYYERLLASQDKDSVANEMGLPEKVEPKNIIRDPYVLEFLGLEGNTNFYVKDLEQAIIDHLQKFLLELGRGFSFVARQQKITFDGRHFFIDLVFYNYILKCFVIIDLKLGDLTHQDLGQMQMYVNYYTREMMNEGDNPPIGIVLCADKSDQVNIDLMIEDSTRISLDLINNGIKVFTMNTRYNQKEQTLDRVSKWKEIYEKISKLNKKEDNKKVNVILDTDIYNECDDQFALSYLLKSQDKFNIEAITVAPYHHDNNISIEEGTDKSYDEIIKICNWLNFDWTNKVFKGSTDYVVNGYNEENDAINKIIEIANKNNKTYILAIGAITNVALAIKKEPKIVDKIEVVWLGGHSFLNKDNKEFNFKQDIQAVRTVFKSKVKLTMIPCKNVASNLRTSIYELEHFLKGKSELCDYLYQRFYNDGVHGIQERRVIWDISVIAYMINKEWFETEEISCPNINDDTSYELTENNYKLTVVNYLNVDKIYKDLFSKLGEI